MRSRTSGSSSSPPQADDLDGQAAVAQDGGDGGHVGAAADQDGGGRRLVAAVQVLLPLGGDGVGDPVQLLADVVEQRHPDVARPGAVAGAQLVDVQARGAQRRGHGVGQGQHLGRVAEAGEQAVLAGGREVVDEPRQVGGGRAAPAVDRLGRVADRRHGHRLAPPEQRPQQHALGVAGVLVLVEQHGAVALALAPRHLGVLGGQPRGQRHLVGEVHGRLAPLARLVRLQQRQEVRPQPLGVDDGLERLRQVVALPLGLRRVLDQRAQPVGVLAQGLRAHQVLPQLAGQRQQVAGDGGGHLVGVDVLRPGGDDAVRELPRRGLGQQPHAGFHGQPQPVLADEPARVGVVGEDHRFAGEDGGPALAARVEPVEQRGAAQAAQAGPDAVGELAGGLAGEREAEDAVGRDEAVGDQVDDAGGHRLGLARARAGHDEGGRGGRGDDGGLLGRGPGQAERLGDLERTGEGSRPAHPLDPVRHHHTGHSPLSARGRFGDPQGRGEVPGQPLIG
ncbi:hypothetical protein GCM10018963_16440 [Saccharothrix longispora]